MFTMPCFIRKTYRVGHGAANALGYLAPESSQSVPSLKKLLDDSTDSGVRQAAAAALKKIQGEER